VDQELINNVTSHADELSVCYHERMVTWTYDVDENSFHFFLNETELIDTVPIGELQI